MGRVPGNSGTDGPARKPYITPMRRTSRREQAQRLEERLVRVGQRTLGLARELPGEHLSRALRGHLEYGCTAPGRDYAAARRTANPERRRDLLARCREGLEDTGVWLELIAELNLVPSVRLHPLLSELDALRRDLAQVCRNGARAVVT